MRYARRAALIATALLFAPAAQAQAEIIWWHSMSGGLGEHLNMLVHKFNESQNDYKVVAVFKGNYPESMKAAMAAFRAGKAPHIVQVFEAGTATMMAAKGTIVPVLTVMANAKEPFDPKAYLPIVTGHYSDLNGNMLSFPFNTSTVMLYINKYIFKQAGLDANKAPKTWKDVLAAADKLKAAGQRCIYTTSWPSWTHIENFSAWHNVPMGTKQNGMGGFDTAFTINSPLHVRHITMLGDMAKKGLFTYLGRTGQGDDKFASGECAMVTASSAAQTRFRKNAKLDWSMNFLPYHDDVEGAPQNTIIGGASLWVMSGKKSDEYKGVAKLFAFLSRPGIQMQWHTSTGYVPITLASYFDALLGTSGIGEAASKSAFYEKNPGADMPMRQLTYKRPSENSKGLRFGNFVQARAIIEEEMEAVFTGRKDANRALDDAVKRGNDILRTFEAGVVRGGVL